ncbi:MAG TPA: M48 family metallopeptidase [Allosphingosinicella sp.]|nr:M48 family metallopeptidase [Allosphingosinicella sp.]
MYSLLSASLAALLALQEPAAAAPKGRPAPGPAAGGSYLRSEDYRVARVGYRLGLAGRSYCPEPYPLTGLLLHHLAEYAAGNRAAAVEEFRIDRGPGVLAVIEGSPAARAGLAAGDVLLAVNARPFRSPLIVARAKDQDSARRAIEGSEAQLEQQLRQGPVRLAVARAGREIEVSLAAEWGCPARVRLARSRQMNAFAHRGYAIVTTAMLGFLRSDDELAFVLGHEIAHNVLKHPQQLDEQGVPRGWLSGIGKNGALVKATEIAADQLGLRLAWAAGYDASAAIPYWRRFYGKYDRLPRLFRTHPRLRERERLARETLASLGAASSDLGPERP